MFRRRPQDLVPGTAGRFRTYHRLLGNYTALWEVKDGVLDGLSANRKLSSDHAAKSRLVVRVQTVDATPSGIKLISKVVFMKPGKRFGLSAAQKLEVWSRWKTGQTLHEIGRVFGKERSSIRCLVALHGGIVPAVRRRSLLAGSLPVRRYARSLNAWPALRRP